VVHHVYIELGDSFAGVGKYIDNKKNCDIKYINMELCHDFRIIIGGFYGR
jgi:hypothetical protein